MTEHSKAGEARQGLIDSVKGKAKEFAGALTNNDSLTAEGQLEQASAKERKEANSVEAIADVEAAKAAADVAAARQEGAQERIAVGAQAAAVENAAHAQQAAEKRAVEQDGKQLTVNEMTKADLDAARDVAEAKSQERAEVGAAAADIADAVDEHQREALDAAHAKAEAERLRRQAATVTHEAELP